MEDGRNSTEKLFTDEELRYEANQVKHDLYHDSVRESAWKSRSDKDRRREDMTPLALYHDSVEEAVFHLNQIYWYAVNNESDHMKHLYPTLRRDIENILGTLSIL